MSISSMLSAARSALDGKATVRGGTMDYLEGGKFQKIEIRIVSKSGEADTLTATLLPTDDIDARARTLALEWIYAQAAGG